MEKLLIRRKSSKVIRNVAKVKGRRKGEPKSGDKMMSEVNHKNN